MSVESFPSNKPQSVAVCESHCFFELKDHIVFSTEPEAFCGVGKVILISAYFSFVKTHFHSPYHSLVKGK